jgi:uncharacterized protein (DUF2267 family)
MGQIRIAVPDELRDAVRVRCAEKKVTLITAVLEALRDWLGKEKK